MNHFKTPLAPDVPDKISADKTLSAALASGLADKLCEPISINEGKQLAEEPWNGLHSSPSSLFGM